MRKSILFVILFPLLFFTGTAAPVVIKGTWERAGDEVSLYHIVSGRLERLSSYILQEDKTFGFSFTPPSAGFYALGSGLPQSRMNKYFFFFNPGDSLHLTVNKESYVLTNGNTPQNEVMTDWHDKIAPLEEMAVYFARDNTTYVDFFPRLEEFLLSGYTPRKTGDTGFDRAFEQFYRYDLIHTAVHYLFTPRSAHPGKEDYADFYHNLDIEKLTQDASLLTYPYGSALLSQLFFLKSILSEKGAPYKLPEALEFIKNDTLKGEYLLQEALRIKTYDGYQTLMEPYRRYIVTADQKKRVADIVEKLAREKQPGEPAIDFTYHDIDGKEVSLSNFKGKVVLVDVWATWCGPCKKELPHLKNLEKEMAGREIVFLCVSVDEAKDHQKWRDFIKKEELVGIQLFAGGLDSDIARFYDIKAIPRFMLFDKAGNIVSKDAPRPSSSELKVLIENELKK